MRDELPVKAHESGNVTTASVDMDATYKYQVYYDLRTNTVVGRNEKTIWDIGLETTADGYHIVMNGAKAMYAMATSKTNFTDVTTADTAGFAARSKWDAFNGSMDSTAIGDWRTNKPVYIVDRGYDGAGKHQGWAKLQMLAVTDSSYIIRFASVNGADEATIVVKKDSAYNLAFVSFATKAQVMVEPVKHSWDIVFSQYTFVFYDMDPPTPYLVTGCLLNRYKTTAYMDTLTSFNEINYGNVATDRLVDDIGVIGYDWKVFNGTKYTVRAKNNYIIRDADGLLYKLHFTAFYNAAGVKGNPQWEFQQL
jgi:hypothetical protein